MFRLTEALFRVTGLSFRYFRHQHAVFFHIDQREASDQVLCQKWCPKQLNRSSDAISQHIVLFHSNYHSTLWINFNHRSIYNDNMAIRTPSQVRLIFYCLSATDRVIRIYKFASCFRLTLPLLNPKALHALHSCYTLNSCLGALYLNSRGRYVGSVISWGRHGRKLIKHATSLSHERQLEVISKPKVTSHVT